jgi:hypothetical protein
MQTGVGFPLVLGQVLRIANKIDLLTVTYSKMFILLSNKKKLWQYKEISRKLTF